MLYAYNCFLYDIKCCFYLVLKSQPEYHIYFQNQYISKVIFVVSNTDYQNCEVKSQIRTAINKFCLSYIYIFLIRSAFKYWGGFFSIFFLIDLIKLSHYWGKSCWDTEFSHWFHICHKRYFLASKVLWLKFLIYDR